MFYGAAGTSANLLSTRARLSVAGPTVPGGEAVPGQHGVADRGAAAGAAVQGMASAEKEGADARLEVAQLREMERLKQQPPRTAPEKSGDGAAALDPLSAVQDLSGAAVSARAAAERASWAASEAVKYYDAGRQKVWKNSLHAAGAQMLKWKKHAEHKTKQGAEARFAPTWQSRAIEEKQKAAKPYVEGVRHAQESARLYNEKGVAMAKAASQFWNEAQSEGDVANKMPRTTIAQSSAAQATMLDAREKAKEAQSMALQSRQYFATAADVQRSIPAYQYNAQKAAAQAVAKMSSAR